MDQLGMIEAKKLLLTSCNFPKEGFASFALFEVTYYIGRRLLKRNLSGKAPKSGRHIPRYRQRSLFGISSVRINSNHI